MTCGKTVEISTEIKKSVFFGSCMSVSSKEQALSFISSVRAKYPDATHVVYAYVLRDGLTERFSDAGEPSGTAGMPVLDCIKKARLTDVCVTVTRYFGGILLGAGGLVRAYSSAASAALSEAGICKMIPCTYFNLSIDYPLYDRLMFLLKDMHTEISDIAYSDKISFTIMIPYNEIDRIRGTVTDLSGGKSELIPIKDGYTVSKTE